MTSTTKMTLSELKCRVQGSKNDSHFFDRDTLKFFGDTMSNYAVSSKPITVETPSGDFVECWELRRKKPVKHGLQASAYFTVDTFARVIVKRGE